MLRRRPTFTHKKLCYTAHWSSWVQPLNMVDNWISLCNPFPGHFFIMVQSRQATFSWKQALFVDFCSHVDRPFQGMILYPHLASWLSSRNLRQGAREQLACRPSSMGSAGCHRRSSLPIVL